MKLLVGLVILGLGLRVQTAGNDNGKSVPKMSKSLAKEMLSMSKNEAQQLLSQFIAKKKQKSLVIPGADKATEKPENPDTKSKSDKDKTEKTKKTVVDSKVPAAGPPADIENVPVNDEPKAKQVKPEAKQDKPKAKQDKPTENKSEKKSEKTTAVKTENKNKTQNISPDTLSQKPGDKANKTKPVPEPESTLPPDATKKPGSGGEVGGPSITALFLGTIFTLLLAFLRK